MPGWCVKISKPMAGRLAASRRGFTLIEMLVVLMILAIIAGMMVPRLVGNNAREFRVTCEEVSGLLTMFARRESMGGKTVGLIYDEDRRQLSLVQYDIDVENPRHDPHWQHDSLIRPVRLPHFAQLNEVRADGQYVDITQWPLMNRPGHVRPAISLSLQGPEGVVTMYLPPHAITPAMVGGVDERMPYPEPIDLNAMGRSRGEW